MSEEKPTNSVSPWQYPSRWSKDETFWRDVASNTTAGLLLALILYLAALGFGYIRSPESKGVLGSVVSGVIILGLGGNAVFRALHAIQLFKEKQRIYALVELAWTALFVGLLIAWGVVLSSL
jgi:hypothetical protein